MHTLIETIREFWLGIHAGSWPELGFWSYALLVLLVATEGPISTLLGAAAAAAGILDIRFVFLSALIGNVTGDVLWYTVGRINNLERIHRFGRWVGLHQRHIDRLEAEMHLHATKLIVLSKLAIGLIIPTLIAAGLARIALRRWLPLVLLVETTWTIVLVNLGYHGAGVLTQFERGIQLFGAIALLLVGSLIVWYGRRIFQQSEASMAAELAEQPVKVPPVEPLPVTPLQVSEPVNLPRKKPFSPSTIATTQRHLAVHRKAAALHTVGKVMKSAKPVPQKINFVLD